MPIQAGVGVMADELSCRTSGLTRLAHETTPREEERLGGTTLASKVLLPWREDFSRAY